MTRGEVFFRTQFEFDNGNKSDKLLIVLNSPSDNEPLVVALTTSTRWKRSAIPGCHSRDNYYLIPAGLDFFKMPTWVLFDQILALEYKQILQWSLVENNLRTVNRLKEDTVRAIINCVKQSLDISGEYIALLK